MSLPSCVTLGKSVISEPQLVLSQTGGILALLSKGLSEDQRRKKIHQVMSLVTGSKVVLLNSCFERV